MADTKTSAAPTTGGRAGAAIGIEGVSKVFGADGPKPFRALENIDMAIRPGEFVSIVGPSGCGKSTLMLMVAGLLERTTGVIRVGESVVDKPITDVGIAFNNHLLLDFRTAIENVMLKAMIRGLPQSRFANEPRVCSQICV